MGPVKALSGPLYEKAGITNEFVAIPPGTPDMTPQVQAALSDGAQMFTIIGDPAFCMAGLGALHALGFQGLKLINSQCLGADFASSVPGGIDGVKVAATSSFDSNDSEVALFEAVMSAYAPETPPHYKNAPEGFAVTLATIRVLNAELNGDLSPASAKAALEGASPLPRPLLAGQTFQCNRKLFTLTPAVCSSSMTVITLDADGQAASTKAIDAQKYFPPTG